jgi:Flp pilus assembly secretin CpaC
MILYIFGGDAASGIRRPDEMQAMALPPERLSTKINKYRLRVESVVERTGPVRRGTMRRLLILVPMLVLASAAAMADGLNINWREARIIKLAKPATSVVIGDPTVADVTLETPTTVVVFGKTPGETNLLVMSKDQELLLDWPVVVSPVTERHVTVLNAGSAEAPVEVLYACGTERCTRVLSPTDVQFRASATSTTTSDTDASKSSSTSESTVNNGVNQTTTGGGATVSPQSGN